MFTRIALCSILGMLVVGLPLRAGAVLGFGAGNTQGPGALLPDPATVPGINNVVPETSYGLNDWSIGSPLGTTNGGTIGDSFANPLELTLGQKFILQLQLYDTSSFTFPNNNSDRLVVWRTRFNYAPGVVSASRDPNALDSLAFEVTVNDGTGFSQSSLPSANSIVSGNSFGIGNAFMSSGWATPNGPEPHFYALANVVITAVGTGQGVLSLTEPYPGQATLPVMDWVNEAGIAFDNVIYATIPQLFIQVNPVPEPSSLVLVCVGVVATVMRRKKLTLRELVSSAIGSTRVRLTFLTISVGLVGVANCQAGAVLGFGAGNTQGPGALLPDPATIPSSPQYPTTSYGLNDWTFGTSIGTTNGGTIGNSAANPLVLTQGEQFILQIQLIDSGSLTFPNSSGGRLSAWLARINFAPGVVVATPDPTPINLIAFEQTVNDRTGFSQRNINSVSHATPSSFGIGNAFGTGGWTFDVGLSVHQYALANVVLSAVGTGDGVITLSDLRPGQGTGNTSDWISGVNTPHDNVIYATIPQLFIHVNPVPEPSALALVCVGVVATVMRRKKLTLRELVSSAIGSTRVRLTVLTISVGLVGVANCQAGAVLGFGAGNTQGPGALLPDPATIPSSPQYPTTSYGLNDWTFGTSIGTTNGGTIGNSAANPLVLTQGEQFFLQIQLIDSGTLTFINTSSGRLSTWMARLHFTPGVVSATPDPTPTNLIAFEQTVNDRTGFSQRNLFSVGYATPSSFGITNSFGPGGWTFDAGLSVHPYALANVLLSAVGPGDAVLLVSELRPGQGSVGTNDFMNGAGVGFDSVIYGTNPQLFIHVNPVPEPSSLAFAVVGFVVAFKRRGCLGIHVKRDHQ